MKKPYKLRWRGDYWVVEIGHQSFQVGPIIRAGDIPREEVRNLKALYRKAITTAFDRMLKDAQ